MQEKLEKNYFDLANWRKNFFELIFIATADDTLLGAYEIDFFCKIAWNN